MDDETLQCSANLQEDFPFTNKFNEICSSILDAAPWHDIVYYLSFVFLHAVAVKTTKNAHVPNGNHRIAQIAIAATVERLIHIYKNKQIAIAVVFMKCH